MNANPPFGLSISELRLVRAFRSFSPTSQAAMVEVFESELNRVNGAGQTPTGSRGGGSHSVATRAPQEAG